MTAVSSPAVWPFAIVQSKLIVSPDFLVESARSDPRIRRLLINEARIDQSRGRALHHRVMTVPGRGSFELAYRYVPMPGGARDDATRPLHVLEGLLCNQPGTPIDDEVIDRYRHQLDARLERYLVEGWSGPPAPSHSEPMGEFDDSPDETSPPPAGVLVMLAAIGAAAVIVLIIRRLLSW
ncbi:hypothetical protein [Actinoplanes sp. NPDC023714]|uniref:hypothetical protein n=1 Tax=Actinoplanes sp. NPDC023714 TaxID=3154322 RepID=UPI0034059B83